MTKKVYIQQAELKHYGVLGMHWGVTSKGASGPSHFARSLKQKYGISGGLSGLKNTLKSNFAKSVKQKYGVDLTPTTHQSKVKSLKTQIKKKTDSRWDTEQRQFAKDESAAYARINAFETKKLAAHDAQSKNFFDSLIGRGVIKLNANIDRSNVVSRLEDKLILESDKRNKAKWAEQKSTLHAFDMKAEKVYNDRIKGLTFPKDLIEALKVDKEMGMEITEAMLLIEKKHS